MGFPQPVINNDAGVIVTIGLVVNADRVACVFPLANDAGLPPETLCSDAVVSFNTSCRTSFLAGMSSDAHIAYAQGEGMVDGKIPYREDYAAGAHPGAIATHAMPNNVTGLGIYY